MMTNNSFQYQTIPNTPNRNPIHPSKKKRIDTSLYTPTTMLTMSSITHHRPTNSNNAHKNNPKFKAHQLQSSATKTSILKSKKKVEQSSISSFDFIEPKGRNQNINKKKDLSFNKKIKTEILNTGYKNIQTPTAKVTRYDRHMKFNSAKTLNNFSESINNSTHLVVSNSNSFINKVDKDNVLLKEKINSILEGSIVDQKYQNEIKKDELIMNNILSKSNSFDKLLKKNEKNTDNIMNNNDEYNHQDNFFCLKNDYDIFYTKEYIEAISDDMIQLELQLLIDKVYEMQTAYHKDFKILFDNYKLYSTLLKTYYKKYFTTRKKYNILVQKKEKMKMKRNLNMIWDNSNLFTLLKKEMKFFYEITKGASFDFTSRKVKTNRTFKNLFLSISQRVKNKLNTNEKKDVSKNNMGRINKKKSNNTKKGKPVNQNFDKIRKVLFHK